MKNGDFKALSKIFWMIRSGSVPDHFFQLFNMTEHFYFQNKTSFRFQRKQGADDKKKKTKKITSSAAY